MFIAAEDVIVINKKKKRKKSVDNSHKLSMYSIL